MMKYGVQVAHIDRLAAGFADVEVLRFVAGLATNAPAANRFQFGAAPDQRIPTYRLRHAA
jgi:hypothetical protein